MPLEPGNVHKQHKEQGGPRLYGIGGRERGFSFAQWFPNGIPLIPAGVFCLIAVVWAVPIYKFAGIHFQTGGGAGTALLLGPPLLAVWATRVKLPNNLTLSEVFTTYFRFFFMEARLHASNETFQPTHIKVRARIYSPRPIENTTTITAPQLDE